MAKISLLAHTYSSYVESLFALLGKGRQHAGLFYEEVIRFGQPPKPDHPAFRNASALLEQLHALTDFTLPTLIDKRSDGSTSKFLLRTEDALEIESVMIPMQSGGTLCISSQVGCRMGCTFCETGRMGLLRNLTTQEIVGQVFMARHHLGFAFTNVVFMGMGEPFDNYDNVLQAARIFIEQKGFGCGKRNVTISTSGRIEEILRLAEEGEESPNLAVSVNAPTDAVRQKIMPINRKHNMAQLYQTMHAYNARTRRQILAAYVLIKDLNSSSEHALNLATYLQGLDVKINIIPYNPQSCDRYQPPEDPDIECFVNILREKGYQTLLRKTKGRPIMAGCGQLGNLAKRNR